MSKGQRLYEHKQINWNRVIRVQMDSSTPLPRCPQYAAKMKCKEALGPVTTRLVGRGFSLLYSSHKTPLVNN